jgi:probable HAF family extracellular repeat protein
VRRNARRQATGHGARALGLVALFWTAGAAVAEETPVLIELPPEALAADVGAGGFVVVGSYFSGGAFHWMPTAGAQAIGGFAGVAVSLNGKAIIGNALDDRGLEQAALWLGGMEWGLLGSIAPDAQPCDLLLSSAFGANDDGRVVVGLAWNGCRIARAFRWEESTGMVDLGSLGGESTRANGVSGDGRVVVGWEEHPTGFRQGAKWVDGREELIQGPSGMVGEAFASNRDGSLIVGAGCDPTDYLGPATAWTWTPAGGVRCFPVEVPADLPDLPYQVLMQATSDDGRVIGGALSFGLDSEALIWLDGQARLLKDYLRQNGLPDAFRGWVNSGFVQSITPDGRTLVGHGAGPTTFQGYMVVFPEDED